MMYEYITLDDGTGIAHSDIKEDGSVKVYIEKPVDGGFKSATCYLPEYNWKDIHGFSDADMEKLRRLIENNAHLIIEFARTGGFENASNY